MDKKLLSILPTLHGKTVCLLQADGRLLNRDIFVKSATKVETIDWKTGFRSSTDISTHLKANLDHVTTVLSQNSYDVIYGEDFFSQLSEEQHEIAIKEILAALRTEGYFLCIDRTGKDTAQRGIRKDVFVNLLSNTVIQGTKSDGEMGWVFSLVLSKPLDDVPSKSQKGTIWLLQKTKSEQGTYNDAHSLHDVLNSKIYTESRILQFEKIFGRTFISTGGIKTTKEFVERLDLQKSQRVLDVGCGVGGSAFYMSKEFGVSVMAIDLATKMIEIGRKRAQEMDITDEMVEFEVADATKRVYPSSSFDVVYSRDTILHIPEKLSLFRNFFNYLKPGGKLLVTDYCCSEGKHTQQFKAYLKSYGYVILTPSEYCKVLKSAGFSNVQTEDKTQLFIKTTTAERQRLQEIKEEYEKEFSEKDFDIFLKMMKNKEQCAGVGDQVWALFYAEKPIK